VQAAESVDGTRVRRARRKLGVELDGRRARVELELAVAYGKVLPEVAQDVHGAGDQRADADVRARRLGGRRHGGGARAVKVPKPKPVSRREARRAAVFVLYQWDVTSSPLGSLFEGEVDAYTQTIADRVAAHAPELDAKITAASDDWTADRARSGRAEHPARRDRRARCGRGAEGSEC